MEGKKRKKREHDFSVTAFRVAQEATGQSEPEAEKTEPEVTDGKNPHAVALGRLGGLKGGKATVSENELAITVGFETIIIALPDLEGSAEIM